MRNKFVNILTFGGHKIKRFLVVSTENCFCISILSGLFTALLGGYRVIKEQETRFRRDEIDGQVTEFYSPMIGNRLLYQSLLSAIEEQYNMPLSKAVQHMCDNKDAEGLENWRRFYTHYLAPLDIEAQELIKSKYMLVNDDQFTEVFKKYLEMWANHQYFVESWVNEKGLHKNKRKYTDKDYTVDANIHEQMMDEDVELNSALLKIRTNLSEELKDLDDKLYREKSKLWPFLQNKMTKQNDQRKPGY